MIGLEQTSFAVYSTGHPSVAYRTSHPDAVLVGWHSFKADEIPRSVVAIGYNGCTIPEVTLAELTRRGIVVFGGRGVGCDPMQVAASVSNFILYGVVADNAMNSLQPR